VVHVSLRSVGAPQAEEAVQEETIQQEMIEVGIEMVRKSPHRMANLRVIQSSLNVHNAKSTILRLKLRRQDRCSSLAWVSQNAR
jgi:hypothetical protein